MKVATYEEYIKSILKGLKIGDTCPACNGNFEVEEECCECGHIKTRRCFCDHGKVGSVKDYSISDIEGAVPKGIYEEVIARDLLNLVVMMGFKEKWINEYFASTRLHPYSKYSNKSVHFSYFT